MTRPVRVWFVAHEGRLKSGANLSLLNLLDGLSSLPVEPRVIVPMAGRFKDELDRRGISVVVQPFPWWVSKERQIGQALRRAITTLSAARPLIGRLKTDRAEIIYTNTSVVALGAVLARRLGIPHVWHLREFGDLDHALFPDWHPRIRQYFYARAAAIIANSHAVRDHHVRGSALARSHVIYNGVLRSDAFRALYERRMAMRRNGRPFTFVLVGRIGGKKGQDLAIRALAELHRRGQHCRLILVGGGPSNSIDACQALVKRLQLGRYVEFWGLRDNPYDAFLEGDAALMCSQTEAMGRVSVEAMATGLPVIGRASGGTPELITHGENGLLFSGGAEALAEAMEQLSTNPEMCARAGRQALSRASERYSIERYASDVARILEAVTRSGPPLR